MLRSARCGIRLMPPKEGCACRRSAPFAFFWGVRSFVRENRGVTFTSRANACGRTEKDTLEATLTQIGQPFGLSLKTSDGVFCSDDGLFVGGVPLLERVSEGYDWARWQLRPVRDLNYDLAKRYGLPVDIERKVSGLSAIARALNNGDVMHARIASLHLQIPDPPAPRKSMQTASEVSELARRLQASGLLKADWDPAKHPRWPAGSPDSTGGRFAPTGSDTGSSASAVSDARIIPTQMTIPAPFDFPMPGTTPFPSEVVPPPAIPNVSPRDGPQNPASDSPDCAEEWADAAKYCSDLMRKGLLGREGYRGQGRTFEQCVKGRVSQRCGGSSVGA